MASDVPFVNFHTPENSDFHARNVYRALDPETADFRFLEILPGGKDDAVRCNLIQSPRSLKYEALSYCAGDPKDTREVLVDGHAFNVFASLFGALVTLRGLSESRVVWIDQICINQNDVIERNQQVRKMKAVYENAERVVAWLGPILDGKLAFDTVRGLHNAYIKKEAALRSGFQEPRELYTSEKVAIEQSIADEYTKELPLANEPYGLDFTERVRALGHLFSAQIWTRVWVWQELILARSILLLWDDASMDSEPLFRAGLVLAQLDRRHGDDPPLRALDLVLNPHGGEERFVHLVQILIMREDRLSNGSCDFKYLLGLSRRAKCSDPRDRVYALCGMISPKYVLYPDYTSSVASTFIRTAWSIISAEQSLNVLIFCQPLSFQSQNPIPSWCPVWSSQPQIPKPRLVIGTYPHHRSRFRACGKLAGKITLNTFQEGEFSRDELSFDGLIIDCIQAVAEDRPEIRTYDELLQSWTSILSEERQVSEGLRAELDRIAVIDYQGHSMSVEDEVIRPVGIGEELRSDALERTRRFFVSEKGLMGLGPLHASPGDFVCILPGTIVPIILRKGQEDSYTVIGEAYVSEGYMEGRAYDEMETGEISLVHFNLR